MSAAFKTLPLTALAVVAVIYQCDETEDGVPLFEYEVFDEKAFERAVIPKHTVRCDCCGHALKYVCVAQYVPTGELYNIGRQCAHKIDVLKRFMGAVENASFALVEKAACEKRERDALTRGTDDYRLAYAWAKTAKEASAVAKDLVAKVRQYGDPSDKQREFLVKLWREDTTRRAAATGVAPSGKQTVTGTVLSVKEQTSDFGTVLKVLLDLGNGAKVYGNAPGALTRNPAPFTGGPAQHGVEKGQRVTFTASFEPSDKDALFGFWKRPTKWSLV